MCKVQIMYGFDIWQFFTGLCSETVSGALRTRSLPFILEFRSVFSGTSITRKISKALRARRHRLEHPLNQDFEAPGGGQQEGAENIPHAW